MNAQPAPKSAEPTQYIVNRIHVTPALAREWLGNNINNRSLKRQNVELIAREMAEGRFRFVPQPVVFARSGRLLDGQHRLEAVILIGKPQDLPVVFDAPDDIQDVLDQGARRSAGDQLAAHGFHQTSRVSAAARSVIVWEKLLPTRAAVPKSEVVQFVLEHPELAEMVEAVAKTSKRQRHTGPELIQASVLGAVGYLATFAQPRQKDRYDAFMEGLHSGVGLSADSPILTLRNFAINMRTGHSIQRDAWFGLVATTWNDYARNRPRKVLRPDNYSWPPEIVGCPFRREPGKVRQPYMFAGRSSVVPNVNVLPPVKTPEEGDSANG